MKRTSPQLGNWYSHWGERWLKKQIQYNEITTMVELWMLYWQDIHEEVTRAAYSSWESCHIWQLEKEEHLGSVEAWACRCECLLQENGFSSLLLELKLGARRYMMKTAWGHIVKNLLFCSQKYGLIHLMQWENMHFIYFLWMLTRFIKVIISQYLHIESLYCASETNVLLYVNYTSIFKKLKVPLNSFVFLEFFCFLIICSQY